MKLILNILKQPKLLLLQAFAFVFLILNSLISILIPVITSRWIDDYFANETINETLLIISIVYLVFGFTIPFVFTLINSVINERIGLALKDMLMQKILAQDYSFLAKTSISKVFTIITSDVNFVKDIVGRLITSIITALLLLVGSVYLMNQQSPAVAIPIFIVIPAIALIVVFILRSAMKLFKQIQEKRDGINKVIDENIKGSMLVRVFVSEAEEEKKFSHANADLELKSVAVAKIFAWIFPLLNTTMFVGQLIVLMVGGQEIMNGNLSLGELSAFNALVMMFTAPFIIIGFISGLLGQAFASLGRINEVIYSPIIKAGGTTAIAKIDNISFVDVSFFTNKNKILSAINLEINASEKIGIIGITGSGKSTLLQLIIHFFKPTKGKVLINGIDSKEINLNTYRNKIGYVPQDNFLFSGSIFDNINFDRKLSKEQIQLAADTAEVTEFSNKDKRGLMLDVGEKGSKLSGGQKQRVTLARALAESPQILILDDSTSKLDSETESKIWNNLAKNYPDLTLIVVAQKISSIKNCNRIYVMENGKIASSGTHQQLLENSFIYQEIELSQNNYQAA